MADEENAPAPADGETPQQTVPQPEGDTAGETKQETAPQPDPSQEDTPPQQIEDTTPEQNEDIPPQQDEEQNVDESASEEPATVAADSKTEEPNDTQEKTKDSNEQVDDAKQESAEADVNEEGPPKSPGQVESKEDVADTNDNNNAENGQEESKEPVEGGNDNNNADDKNEEQSTDAKEEKAVSPEVTESTEDGRKTSSPHEEKAKSPDSTEPTEEGRKTTSPQVEEQSKPAPESDEGTNAPPPTADVSKPREPSPVTGEMQGVVEESPAPVMEEKAATPQQAPPSRETTFQSASNALNLSWCFGVNKNVPTINLTDNHRQMVLYACGNTAILFDYAKNTQRLLQGHSNDICSTCASEDKRWVVTADKGINSMVIIWDSYTGTPVQTLFDAHPDVGVACMAMTPDAKYLVTIGASSTQTVHIWDWTTDGENPVCSCELSESFGAQFYVHFNPEDTTQIVSNSDNQVIFYSWKGGVLKYFAPLLTDQDFNRVVGNYSQSIFCTGSTRALTATSVGNVVVWDNNRPISGAPSFEPSPDKKAFKLVRLQDKGITVLTTTDRYVVTGDIHGHVKFYDQQLRMSNWYNEFGVGPINAISFAHITEFNPHATEDSDYPPDATINASSFVTRNYILSTTTAQIALVIADGTKVKMIQEEHDAAVHAMAAHPTEPFIAIGSYSGLLKIWNYKAKAMIASRLFPRGHHVRCLAYDPKGMYLGIGFTNGCVYILDSLTLDNEVPEPFRYSRNSVTHCTFSLDSKWMATADADHCVTLFKAEKADSEIPWTYLGKHRAHYKPIRGLTFGLKLDTTAPRLLSVGEDRSLVEYDLVNSGIDDLKLVACDRIEQSAVPQCIAWHPSITKEQFFLFANNQYKFKLYNTTTKMCRKTLLGPTYGSPLQKIEVLPTADEIEDKRYLAYVTTDKVGLHIMPLDGNPHNSIARIAHPSGVTNMVCSHDGKHVFTAGGTDASVSMWDVAIEVLEAGSQLGGEDLIPFYGLLEGGREGELFKELENYFYYAQIRSQGVDTMATRQVSTHIPLSEIPFVMRALGHYPSEQEIEDMVNEIKFSRYVDTGEYVSDIDLGTFIKLYVNHRPAFGLSATKLYEAFEVLGLDEYMGAPAIDRGELLDILQTKGEHMTEAEVAEYITTLLGLNPEGGSSELGSYDAAGAADILEEALPEQITGDMFTSEVLGFGGPVEVSTAGSSYSYE